MRVGTSFPLGFLFLKTLFLSGLLAGSVNRITTATLCYGMYFQNPFHTKLPSENTLAVHRSQTTFSPVSASAKPDPSGSSPAEYIPRWLYIVCQETEMTLC